tara:strand:- start:8050 stop:8211 length:162 start_codon:yes stop_codon:yes gene_type:complete
MAKTIKLILIKAFEEKMLKIYATIMTTIFLAIWIPTMAIALKNLFVFWYEFLF